MLKRFFGWTFFGCCLLLGATLASAQCGDHFQRVVMNCGIHCGSFSMLTCQGDGTLCQDDTGDPGSGCCGFQFFDAGSCTLAKATPSKELPPTREFLAFQDAVKLHKKLFSQQTTIVIASCGPDKNAFNHWLNAKLQQQQQQR